MPDQDDDQQNPGVDLSAYGLGAANPTDDSDRVTIGQRMAGLGPKPAPAPVDNTPAPASVPLDISKLPPGLSPPTPSPSSIPSPPTGANNPNLVDLAKQQAQYGKPTDPNAIDPKTGKPMYKMGTGGRILAALTDFAQGFSKSPQQPIYFGKGATNARYDQAERMRQGNLANVDTQIGTQEKMDTENQKLYDSAIKQAYDTQLGSAKEATAAAAGQNAETRSKLAQTTTELNDTKEQLNQFRAGQAQEPKTLDEIALAKQTAMARGDKAKVAIYDGALKELARQKAAGKDTTAADTSKAIQVATYRTTETNKVQQEQTQEAERRYAELDKDITVKYDPAKKAAAKAQIDQELQTKYAPRIQDVNDQADKMLGLTKAGKSLQSGNQPAKPTGSKIDPNNLPKTVIVGGKTRTVAGYNKQTKKVILAPE